MEFRNTGYEYKIDQQHFITGRFKIRSCWLKPKLHLGTLIILSLKFRKEESKEGEE